MTLRISPAQVVSESSSPLLGCKPAWPRIRLGEVATILNGFPFKSESFRRDEGMPLLRIRDVGRQQTETRYVGSYDQTYVVHRGDIVVGMDGDFRVAKWNGDVALLNQRVCRIDVDGKRFLPEWLLYVLPGYLDAVSERTSAITVKHLSSRDLLELPLPFPPLDEQRLIVSAIEKQLSRLESGQASLHAAAHRLDLVPGLIADRCGANSQQPPDDWRLVTIGDIAVVRSGIQKQPKRKPITPSARPYMRVANVLRGRLDLDDVQRMELFEGEFDKFRLARGDLLVVEGNGSKTEIGRAALWNGEIPECVHQNHIIRVRPDPSIVESGFLEIIWNAPATARRIAAMASSTSGLYVLNSGKVRSLKLAIPPIEIQQSLLAKISEQREQISRLASEVAIAMRRGDSLRKSILATAFTGRLPMLTQDGQAGAMTQPQLLIGLPH